jgi:alkylhydroperoxidase family enzyme
MSEPRLRPLSKKEATGEQRLLIETAEHNGAPDPLCAQIYVRAEVGRNWLRHWNELLNGGILPVALKEMCRVLISMKHGCGYCSTVRSRVAFENGLTEEKLMATMDFENSPLFNQRERAALRFATLFKQSDDAIDNDDVYAELKKHFSEEEVIELALLCGETDGVGKFARSLRIRTWEEACSIQPLLRAKMARVSAQAAE